MLVWGYARIANSRQRKHRTATELGRVLFSQDADLLVVAKEWQESGRDFAGLFYGHQLQLTIGQAVRDLQIAAEILELSEIQNRVEYLPL